MTFAFALSWMNFLLLVGFLFVRLRKPAKAWVAARSGALREELGSVREQLATAKASYDEYSAKLKAIDAELRALREEASVQARAAQARITGEAQRLAGQVVADARTASEVAVRGLKQQLVSEFGLRILAQAEQEIRERLTRDDRTRIRQEFSRMVESGR